MDAKPDTRLADELIDEDEVRNLLARGNELVEKLAGQAGIGTQLREEQTNLEKKLGGDYSH